MARFSVHAKAFGYGLFDERGRCFGESLSEATLEGTAAFLNREAPAPLRLSEREQVEAGLRAERLDRARERKAVGA